MSPDFYNLAISMISGLGTARVRKLVSYCGSPEAVFKERDAALLKIPDIGKALVKKLKDSSLPFQLAEEEMLFCEKHEIDPLFYLHEEFPKRLNYCTDGPVMLYTKGKRDFNRPRVVAIVGTRTSTDLGNAFCEKLLKDIAEFDSSILIVSGLAYGIDITAQKEALKNKLSTSSVLANNLSTIYPPIHKKYADEIEYSGGLISEFRSYDEFDRQNFLERNRIIAGMADAVIVVESARKGGSLYTAQLANGYNREVFAVPGRLNDINSQGCNWLIKTHQARLIEDFSDIQYVMGWDEKEENRVAQMSLFPELSEEEEKVVAALQEHSQLDIDRLADCTRMPIVKLNTLLLNMEFKGLLRALPGKVYACSI